jgi:8-oxo-dGTP pyrophosphatase MutT (NUDIX family)
MTKLQPWQILASEIVFIRKWFQVRQDTVKLENSQVIDDYFLFLKPDIVQIFALTPNNEIVFVRQYRHGAGEVLWELPAGNLDSPSESPEAAAERELEEETGYVAEKLIPLGFLYDNPPKETNKIYTFLAEGATPSGTVKLDSTEQIEVVLIPIEDVREKIFKGEIRVSKVIAGIVLSLNYLEENREPKPESGFL